MERQEDSALRSLIEEVVKESQPNSRYIPGRGPATEVMAARLKWEGYRLACDAKSGEEFSRAYNSQVVGDFRVPDELAVKALEGAKAAVELGLSKLTDREIDRAGIINIPYDIDFLRNLKMKLAGPKRFETNKEIFKEPKINKETRYKLN